MVQIIQNGYIVFVCIVDSAKTSWEGIDQRSVNFIENGSCNLSNLVAISDVFGVTLDYILKRSDDRVIVIKNPDEIDFLLLEQFKGLPNSKKAIESFCF